MQVTATNPAVFWVFGVIGIALLPAVGGDDRIWVPTGLPVRIAQPHRSCGEPAILVEVLRDGTVGVHGRRFPAEELPGRLSPLFVHRAEWRLLLTAEANVDFAQVVHVIDIARAHGIEAALLTPLVEKEDPRCRVKI